MVFLETDLFLKFIDVLFGCGFFDSCVDCIENSVVIVGILHTDQKNISSFLVKFLLITGHSDPRVIFIFFLIKVLDH